MIIWFKKKTIKTPYLGSYCKWTSVRKLRLMWSILSISSLCNMFCYWRGQANLLPIVVIILWVSNRAERLSAKKREKKYWWKFMNKCKSRKVKSLADFLFLPEGRAKVDVFVVLLASDSEALIWSSTIAVKFFSEKKMFFLKLFIYFFFSEISAFWL